MALDENQNKTARSGEDWRPCHPMFRKRLTSGEYSNPPELLMRTTGSDGKKLYRRPTAQEEADYVSGVSW